MKTATLHLCRYFLILSAVSILSWQGSLKAQATDQKNRFYLGFTGSVVFPYDSKPLPDANGQGIDFKAGGGFTAAFGYAFKEGFSTEVEWGYQQASIGNPPLTVAPQIDLGELDLEGFDLGDLDFGGLGGLGGLGGFEFPSITITLDGRIKSQSLMGNVYYRYPKWKVSPYAGFGVGAFFHDGTFTTSADFGIVDFGGLPGAPSQPIEPLSITATYDDSRFGYQIMAGLSARLFKLLELRLGYRFRSSRGEPIDSDQIEAGIRFRF